MLRSKMLPDTANGRMGNMSNVSGTASSARLNRTENYHIATNSLPTRFGLIVLILTVRTIKQVVDQFDPYTYNQCNNCIARITCKPPNVVNECQYCMGDVCQDHCVRCKKYFVLSCGRDECVKKITQCTCAAKRHIK